MPRGDLLVYGANGYTGELIAREAQTRGMKPILAGRTAETVKALATELGFDHRVFSLDDPTAVDAGLAGIGVVLHCAGPFEKTSKPMVEGCLRNKAHYLDITGEIDVFEAMARRDAEAKKAGVMLLPGAGFDVVPSDCLAAHLKARLPTATRLTLAFLALGRLSRGTATTAVGSLHKGGMVRRDGVLTPVPAAWKTRLIDFGDRRSLAITAPWGDVSTAFHSTGIPNIEFYIAGTASLRFAARMTRYVGWLLGTTAVQDFLKNRIRAGRPGPDAAERARGKSLLWGEASDTSKTVVSRLRGPDGYVTTVLTALSIAAKALGGEAPPGFQTPSRAYGADFIVSAARYTREDVS
jgi:short subunit dehydrogenase-like uncharacterized protein